VIDSAHVQTSDPGSDRWAAKLSVMRQLAYAMTLGLLLVGCASTENSGSKEENEVVCEEPVNPYTEGTGHHAGYEWAESEGSGTCNGSSQSFNEGCEEYETQVDEHDECEAKKK
jgi:hypothetical protein